jgi:hypothetical protein
MMTRQICKALAILNRRPLQGAARPGAALGGSGCDRHERVGKPLIKWSKGMPLFATLQSDFHSQYLSRANTRWT